VNDAVVSANVNSSCSHIGRNQHTNLDCAEFSQGLFALTLAHVCVNRRGVHALLVQLINELVSATLGANENDGLLLRVANGCRDFDSVHLVHIQEMMHHGRHRLSVGNHFMKDRVFQITLHEAIDRADQERAFLRMS